MGFTLARSLELLAALVAKEFKVRYKNTALGFLWSLANPIFFALVFWVVFEHVLRSPTENYLVFLLTGLFPWQWFANTVMSSPSMFIGNAGLIKKVYFPRLLLPVATLSSNLIHFLLALAVAVPILAWRGAHPSPLWLACIPLLLLAQGMMTLGVSLALSCLNVFFRDLEYLTMVAVNLLFFLTPILYSETALPEGTRAVLRLNPLTHVIPQWRGLILEGRCDWAGLGMGLAAAAVVLAAGYGIYRRTEWRLAESL